MSLSTLKIPAAYYDEALAFCNERLAAQGKPPITELPAGRPQDADSCPCGRACDVRVYSDSWSWRELRHQTQGHPTRFVSFFDHNRAGVKYDVLPIRDGEPS